MKKRAEERFQEIANNATRDAADVTCPLEDYIDGLKTIIDELHAALDAARGDLKARDRGER